MASVKPLEMKYPPSPLPPRQEQALAKNKSADEKEELEGVPDARDSKVRSHSPQPYTVHHGRSIGRLSAKFEKSHSVPALFDRPQTPRSGKAIVGEIDKKHINVRDRLADRSFQRGHSVPRLFDSPHTPNSPRGKAEVGEIDREHIKRVKELANAVSKGRMVESMTIPKLLESPKTTKSKAEVGEIDTGHIKKVKELADMITTIDLVNRGAEI